MTTPASNPSSVRRPLASSYIPGLDGFRAIAILLVFFAHAAPARIGVLIPATLGVTIFFFLSGYLITTLLRREFERTGTISFRDFYIRRSLRILPPLYIIYVLAVLLDRFVRHGTGGTVAGGFAILFYYLNYAYALGPAGHHFAIVVPEGLSIVWSLCIEEHFYLLFPLVFLALARSRLSHRSRLLWLVGFCVLEALWRSVRSLGHIGSVVDWNYYATDARLDSILWGCILAIFANPICGDRPALPRRGQATTFFAAILLLGASLLFRNELYRDAFRYTVQALLLIVIFSFVLARSSHWAVRWLEWPVIRYIGWISYGLYLCHYAILATLEARLTLSPLALVVVGLVLSVGFATLLRYAVELPAQRLRSRFRRIPEADRDAPDGHGLIS